MNRASGDMAVHTFVAFQRRPFVLHLTFEPLGGTDGMQGLQLVTVLYEYNAGPPFVDVGRIHVTAHALERLVSRGHLLTTKQWVSELRVSVLSLYLLHREPDLIAGILALGPGNRFHVRTEHGYARVLYEEREFVFVTWLHELDLSDEQRIEASLQEAEIARCNNTKLGCPLRMADALN